MSGGANKGQGRGLTGWVGPLLILGFITGFWLFALDRFFWQGLAVGSVEVVFFVAALGLYALGHCLRWCPIPFLPLAYDVKSLFLFGCGHNRDVFPVLGASDPQKLLYGHAKRLGKGGDDVPASKVAFAFPN